MKFYVDCFGCRCNQAETQDWIIHLEHRGYQLARTIADADFGIVNTCSVTGRAERDIHRHLRKMYKISHKRWIVAGCTVSQSKTSLQEQYPSYLFLDNHEKQDLVATVEHEFPLEGNIIYHSAYRSRAFLKVQDGCNFRCAFCIVPSLRGKSSSEPLDRTVSRARQLTALGYREVILTGINLSSYGYDLFPRRNLLDLVRALAQLENLDFIRISSLDPRYIRYPFIKGLAGVDKVVPSFHFSFQSGSDAVLRRMNRSSKTRDFHKILEHFRHYFPEANLGADILVGFPGETDKEFRETIDFIKDSPLNYLHVFPFSPREGTRAAALEPLPSNLLAQRVRELKEMNITMRLRYRERFIGTTRPGILIEEDARYSVIITDNFLTVRLPAVTGYRKKPVRVRIDAIINETLCEGTFAGIDRISVRRQQPSESR